MGKRGLGCIISDYYKIAGKVCTLFIWLMIIINSNSIIVSSNAPAATKKLPTVYDEHFFAKRYTKHELVHIFSDFNLDPSRHSQDMGDLIIWQLNRKCPQFAKEFAQVPEIANGIDAAEARAILSICELIDDVDLPPNLFDKEIDNSNDLKIRLQWTGEEESDWSGWFMNLGVTQVLPGKALSAEPISFEEEDKVYHTLLKQRGVVRWKSKAGGGDKDGLIVTLDCPRYRKLSLHISGIMVEFNLEDVLLKELLFDRSSGLKGQLTIGNAYQKRLSPELIAIREMVLSGEPDPKFSAPLQALLWGFMDGSFKQGENPLKKYTGVVEFIKPLWNKMNGPRWTDFEAVGNRLNTPELFDYWVDNKIKFGPRNVRHTKPSKQTFKDLSGDCSDVCELGQVFLKKAGIDLIKICKPTHVMGYIRAGELYWVVIDFTPDGNSLRGPSKSLENLVGVTIPCGRYAEPY